MTNLQFMYEKVQGVTTKSDESFRYRMISDALVYTRLNTVATAIQAFREHCRALCFFFFSKQFNVDQSDSDLKIPC